MIEPQQAVLLALGLPLLAFCFAKLEIQIEGPSGWATSLPTWRIERHWLLDVFFGGRALTGYHAWALGFMLIAFHFPALVCTELTLRLEARLIASYIAFWILEDLLWFLLNPAWGWRRFKRTEAVWHKHWVAGLPVEYWIFSGVTALLLWYSFRA
jgi:hypothetical protein